MHVEEYGLLEKNGVQLGVGTTKSGLGVLLYASCDDSSVNGVSSERFKVISTSDSSRVLSALDGNISDNLSLFDGDVSFVALDLSDKSSIIGRKKGEKIEVWRCSRFDGFGHILSSDDTDPVSIDWYDDFSSFSTKLWDSLPGYQELSIDVEGGVRRFNR